MRSEEDGIHSAICIEREVERSAYHTRRESNEEENVPAGLVVYPHANSSCNEPRVPRRSVFTVISIGSAGQTFNAAMKSGISDGP